MEAGAGKDRGIKVVGGRQAEEQGVRGGKQRGLTAVQESRHEESATGGGEGVKEKEKRGERRKTGRRREGFRKESRVLEA